MNATFILSTSYDGKLRRIFPKTCQACGVVFYRPKHTLGRAKYCSRTCSSKSSRSQIELSCDNCGRIFSRVPSSVKVGSTHRKHGKFFCSRVCKDEAQSLEGSCPEIRPNHYGDGRASYRSRVDTSKCMSCGDTRSFIIRVHHIDGDKSHNRRENLEAVCPNCHALRHLKMINNEWVFDTHTLTARELIPELTVGFTNV